MINIINRIFQSQLELCNKSSLKACSKNENWTLKNVHF